MRRAHIVVLAFAATLLTAGCSSSAAPSEPPNLEGRTYLSTELEGAVLVPGTQVTLSFADGNLRAQAGCNIMGGPYTITGDRITTTQLSMTEMGCDAPRQAQDEWLARFLGDAQFALQGDTLTLTDGVARLTLVDKEIATPDKPLEGTRWTLDGIVSGESVSSVPLGVTAAIQIDGGRVGVEAGCNTGGGTVAVTADTLTFGPIALTKMACEGPSMAVESAVLATLSGDVGYAIDADVLTLEGRGTGLTLRAAR